MRQGRSSQTAAFVAFARALADRGLTRVDGFHDPFAERLLSPGWRRVLMAVARRTERLDPQRRARITEQLDMIPLRVRAIDREIEDAVASGCGEVVVLGAGLDTRAYRLEALRATRVFEVDHPATQAFKRRQAGALSPIARELVYVPVDFERGSVATALRDAGHHADQRTVWVWEGVVMYLTDAALRGALAAIAERSAPGSVLVTNYHEPDSGPRSRVREFLLSRVWGEPQIGLRTRDRMREELERAGFRVLRDTGAVEWSARFGAPVGASAHARVARVVVAAREGHGSGSAPRV